MTDPTGGPDREWFRELEDDDWPPTPPGGPAASCRRCASSGVGVCDDYPDCQTIIHVIVIDPSDTGAAGVYDHMIKRTGDGPDPLVPEPGPGKE